MRFISYFFCINGCYLSSANAKSEFIFNGIGICCCFLCLPEAIAQTRFFEKNRVSQGSAIVQTR
ncbi:MAG: hypothetical protein F6J93_19135 [Oscillatoria sp. SIO1A7]|nr:hypothetical protein [Oscillatoria sp. SIO1A7]